MPISFSPPGQTGLESISAKTDIGASHKLNFFKKATIPYANPLKYHIFFRTNTFKKNLNIYV